MSKICILSENSNGAWPNVHYRNLGASEVRRVFTALGHQCDLVEWFTHWSDDQLSEYICKFFGAVPDPVIAISVPFMAVDVFKITSVLNQIKSQYPDLRIIVGGNRFHEPGLDDIVDAFFIGRSMEMLVSWISGECMSKFQTAHDKVFLNTQIDLQQEPPVFGFYDDQDCLTPQDVLGIEIGVGCRFNCTFCNYDLRGLRNPSLASSELIADFMQRVYDRYGVKHFYLADDTWNESIEKMQTLVDAVESLSYQPVITAYARLDLLGNPAQQDLWRRLNPGSVFFGIETLTPAAAKHVRKSGQTDKLIEILKTLRTLTPDTYMSGSMIVGLNGDSEKDLWWGVQQIIEHKLLDAVNYVPLVIKQVEPTVLEESYQSDLDRDPEKFGYTLGDAKTFGRGDVIKTTEWISDWCTRTQAEHLCVQLTQCHELAGISSMCGFEYLSLKSMNFAQTRADSTGNVSQILRKRAAGRANYLKKQYIINKIHDLTDRKQNEKPMD